MDWKARRLEVFLGARGIALWLMAISMAGAVGSGEDSQGLDRVTIREWEKRIDGMLPEDLAHPADLCQITQAAIDREAKRLGGFPPDLKAIQPSEPPANPFFLLHAPMHHPVQLRLSVGAKSGRVSNSRLLKPTR